MAAICTTRDDLICSPESLRKHFFTESTLTIPSGKTLQLVKLSPRLIDKLSTTENHDPQQMTLDDLRTIFNGVLHPIGKCLSIVDAKGGLELEREKRHVSIYCVREMKIDLHVASGEIRTTLSDLYREMIESNTVELTLESHQRLFLKNITQNLREVSPEEVKNRKTMLSLLEELILKYSPKKFEPCLKPSGNLDILIIKDEGAVSLKCSDGMTLTLSPSNKV